MVVATLHNINSRTSCSRNLAGDQVFCQTELLQSNLYFNFVIVSSNFDVLFSLII